MKTSESSNQKGNEADQNDLEKAETQQQNNKSLEKLKEIDSKSEEPIDSGVEKSRDSHENPLLDTEEISLDGLQVDEEEVQPSSNNGDKLKKRKSISLESITSLDSQPPKKARKISVNSDKSLDSFKSFPEILEKDKRKTSIDSQTSLISDDSLKSIILKDNEKTSASKSKNSKRSSVDSLNSLYSRISSEDMSQDSAKGSPLKSNKKTRKELDKSSQNDDCVEILSISDDAQDVVCLSNDSSKRRRSSKSSVISVHSVLEEISLEPLVYESQESPSSSKSKKSSKSKRRSSASSEKSLSSISANDNISDGMVDSGKTLSRGSSNESLKSNSSRKSKSKLETIKENFSSEIVLSDVSEEPLEELADSDIKEKQNFKEIEMVLKKPEEETNSTNDKETESPEDSKDPDEKSSSTQAPKSCDCKDASAEESSQDSSSQILLVLEDEEQGLSGLDCSHLEKLATNLEKSNEETKPSNSEKVEASIPEKRSSPICLTSEGEEEERVQKAGDILVVDSEPTSSDPLEIPLQKPISNNELSLRKARFLKSLIFLVKKHPALYNVKNKNFKNLKAKNKIWLKIGKRINLNGEKCRNLWFDLRSDYQTYVREMRKFLATRNKDKKDRPLHAFENEMVFLWKFITNSESSAPLPYEAEKETSKACAAQPPPSTSAEETTKIDDDVYVVEKPIDVIEIDDDDVTPQSTSKKSPRSNDSHKPNGARFGPGLNLRLNLELYKLIESVKCYPDLYNPSYPYYSDFKRKGFIWSSIANELNDKATKLMKCWFFMYTRFEWEYNQHSKVLLGKSLQYCKSEIEMALTFLEKHVDKNKDSVFKQSKYLCSRWFDPIDNFKNIYNLLATLKKNPKIVNFVEDNLVNKTSDMTYFNNWSLIANTLNAKISAGQCETTWLLLRNFYWELINMRKHGYQLQDKWYFESIITDLYAAANDYKKETTPIVVNLDEDSISSSKIVTKHAKGAAHEKGIILASALETASAPTVTATPTVASSTNATKPLRPLKPMRPLKPAIAVTPTPSVQLISSTPSTSAINQQSSPAAKPSQPPRITVKPVLNTQAVQLKTSTAAASTAGKTFLQSAGSNFLRKVVVSSSSPVMVSLANSPHVTTLAPMGGGMLTSANMPQNHLVSTPLKFPRITSACSLAPAANLMKNNALQANNLVGRTQIQIKTASPHPPPLVPAMQSTISVPSRPTIIVKSAASLNSSVTNYANMPPLMPKPQQISISGVQGKVVTNIMPNTGTIVRAQPPPPANVFTQIPTAGPVPVALNQNTVAQPKTYLTLTSKGNTVNIPVRPTLQANSAPLITKTIPTFVTIQQQQMPNAPATQTQIQIRGPAPQPHYQPILPKLVPAITPKLVNIRPVVSQVTSLASSASSPILANTLAKPSTSTPTSTSTSMSLPVTIASSLVTTTSSSSPIPTQSNSTQQSQNNQKNKTVIQKSGNLGSNEVMIELIRLSNGNFLVIEGPMLKQNYTLSMAKTSKFIREIMSIPLLHNKNYKNVELMVKYWSHISTTFNLPVSICRAAWNFLSDNFRHFPSIGPIQELTKPVKISNFKVWQESHELFKKFNTRAMELGWLKFASQLPSVMETVEKYPKLYIDIIRNGFKISSDMENIDVEKATAIITKKFSNIPNVMAIWKAFKDVFLRYMIDLEYGIENSWPHNWWRALAKCKFLMEARYHDMQPFYYIVKNKIIEEIERRTQFENKMIKIGHDKVTAEQQAESKPGKLTTPIPHPFEGPGVKLKLRDDIDAYELLVAIRKFPKVYEKCSVEDKQRAWHNVAKELNKSINACRLTFQYALKTYRRYRKTDVNSRCLINSKYFKHFEEIDRAVRLQQRKISIKTPSQLNQQTTDLEFPTGFVYPEYYIPEINMRTCSPGVVVKNWAYALGTFSRYDQGLLEPKLRSLFAKYGAVTDPKIKQGAP